MPRTIFDCVVRLTPERYAPYKNSPTNDWKSNRIKNAMIKRDILFLQRTNDPKQENREIYRRQRNLVMSLISNAKRLCN